MGDYTKEEEVLKYFSEQAGMDLSIVQQFKDAVSLLKLKPRRNHILSMVIISATHDILKGEDDMKAVKFEEWSMTNYVVGTHNTDEEFKIGDVVHFGSNVIPNEFYVEANPYSVHNLKKASVERKEVIIHDAMAKERETVSGMASSEDDSVFISNAKPITVIKFLMYNVAHITGISEFEKHGELKIRSLLK